MNIAQALAAATGLGLARLDAQLLLLHSLGRRQADRTWLLAHDTDALGEADEAAFLHLSQRRATGEPLAYLVGRKEFFGLDLMVDRRVLVPRPDTETLVEWALEILAGHSGPDPGSTGVNPGEVVRHDKLASRVIDLGTGSGAIALAIKNNRPQAAVEAVDANADALEVAKSNARALRLDVAFRQAFWLEGTDSRYDLIVSNPPYIAEADGHLADLRHEPLSALAAGADGLRDIRAIIEQAPGRLRPGGWLLLEHGYDQPLRVRELLEAAGFRHVAGRRDLAGIERCSGGQWLELG